MASRKKKQQPSNQYWKIAIVFSVLMLALFLYLQKNDSKMLNLEIKWIVVASIPLILAILRSNVIQKFKGFGIELETRLQESPIGIVNLEAVKALANLPSDEKQSILYLENLSKEKRMQTQRLTMREGRQNYYNPEAIRMYIKQLPNLKYFEILSSESKFVALIPIELFRTGEFIDSTKISNLIDHIAEKETLNFLPPDIISDTVLESENIIKVLPLVRKSKYGLLPVISDSGNLIGVVTTDLIESKIADEVLAAQKSV